MYGSHSVWKYSHSIREEKPDHCNDVRREREPVVQGIHTLLLYVCTGVSIAARGMKCVGTDGRTDMPGVDVHVCMYTCIREIYTGMYIPEHEVALESHVHTCHDTDHRQSKL